MKIMNRLLLNTTLGVLVSVCFGAVLFPCLAQESGVKTKKNSTLLTLLGQAPCAPATTSLENSLSNLSETEYQRQRADSQRIFSSGAGATLSLAGAAIGMETFGDAYGAESSSRFIEIMPAEPKTFTVTASGGSLDSYSYQLGTLYDGTWKWTDNNHVDATEPPGHFNDSGNFVWNTGVNGSPFNPTFTSPPNGGKPTSVSSTSFSEPNGFSLSGVSINFQLPTLPQNNDIVSASNIVASGLDSAVATHIMTNDQDAIANSITLNSAEVNVISWYESGYIDSGKGDTGGDGMVSSGFHGLEGSYMTEEGYSFDIPQDFATFVYTYFVTSQSPTGNRIAAPHTTLGRIKITENFNPLPQDRLILDYSFFHNVPLGLNGTDVHRFTPGIEKTFFNGLTSVELRIPMGLSLDSNIQDNGLTDTSNAEFGDVTLIFKGLLLKRNKFLISGGLSLSLPTADDTYLYNSLSGQKLLRIENESVHLMPFLAFQYTPNRKWYTQLYYQIDIDSKGSSVYHNPELGFGAETLDYAGKTKDMTYQYVSASVGRWLYRNDHKRRGLTAMNLVGELHWTKSLDRGHGVDIVNNGATVYRISNGRNNCDLINATIGTHLIFNRRANLGLAFTTPVTSNYRQFDGELRATFNYYF
jgi:hypothetical protein